MSCPHHVHAPSLRVTLTYINGSRYGGGPAAMTHVGGLGAPGDGSSSLRKAI